MSAVAQRENEGIAKDEALPWSCYEGKTVVVTGATGLIGKTLVGALLARERLKPSGMRVVALVRNVQRLEEAFGKNPALVALEWHAEDAHVDEDKIPHADFVFHCANMTDSASFVQKPVEVIKTTVNGAQAMLDLAHRTGACMCLLSTMETYGEVVGSEAVSEDQGGFLDAMVVRNSYPEAKRFDECMCAAYASEYDTRAVVVRLVQTFGPGVDPADGRVFAYFARQALAGEDIVMLTKGDKQNAYLYTADAATALLVAAAKGEAGQAYNAANDQTFCSVRHMAQLVAEHLGDGRCAVRFEIDPEAAKRFRKGSVLNLNTERLRALGWSPKADLVYMYDKMVADWREGQGL